MFCFLDVSEGFMQSTLSPNESIFADGALPLSLWYAVSPSIPTLCLVMIVQAC